MIVEAKNLFKSYEDKLALDNFSMSVKEGEILGLLGPNGSGKTTGINCILGLISYDSGQVKIMSKPMKENSYEIKRQIGLVPQDISIFWNLSVFENIDYFCGLYIFDKKQRRAYVDEAMDFVGLSSYRNYQARKLSGGLARRLNIACGISHKPKLIFLDEPTVAVDPQSRNFILDGVRNLASEGATIVYTSHYLEEVEKISTRINIMDKGRIIANGSQRELKDMLDLKEIITVKLYDSNLKEDLKGLRNLIEIQEDSNNYTLKFNKESGNLARLISYLEEKEIAYENLYLSPPSLNDVFLELTGKELRD